MIIVVASAAVALGLVAARWLWWPSGPSDPPRPPLSHRLGGSSWRFGESWASNITAVGAFLGLIVATGIVSSPGRYVSPFAVIALSLSFGFLVVLAPFAYNASSSPPPSDPTAPPPTGPVALEGFVATFLLSSTITIWAVLGQLATIGLVLAELAGAPLALLCYVLFLAPAAGLVLRYGWCSIRWVIVSQVSYKAQVAGLAPGARPARPQWTTL